VTTVLALFALVSSIFVPGLKRLYVAVSGKSKSDGKLELQYTGFNDRRNSFCRPEQIVDP
jgi:hypothetical protein